MRIKRPYVFFIALFFSQIHIGSAQILEAAWYEESVSEQAQKERDIRQNRAEQHLKEVYVLVYGNGVSYKETYDKQGRTVHFLSFHKSSYRIGSDNPLSERKLKNEWFYAYDAHGQLLKAVNEHDFIEGTVYGGDKPFSDPVISAPWTFKTLHGEAECTYKYDNEGKLIEQTGWFFREPYPYHRTNAYRVYDGQNRLNRKFRFMYEDSGKPIEQLEYRIVDDAENLIFRRVFEYDSANRIVRETVYSGGNIIKQFSFEYDDGGRIIERRNERFKERYLFKYNEHGKLLQAQKYDGRGKLCHQQDYEYNEKNLLVKVQYTGGIINQSQRNASYVYEYDDKGRVAKKKSDYMECTFTYYD